MKKKEFVITDYELVSAHPTTHPDQVLLRLLKEKGAPVDGVLLMKPMTEGYEWERLRDSIKRETIFRITKVGK